MTFRSLSPQTLNEVMAHHQRLLQFPLWPCAGNPKKSRSFFVRTHTFRPLRSLGEEKRFLRRLHSASRFTPWRLRFRRRGPSSTSRVFSAHLVKLPAEDSSSSSGGPKDNSNERAQTDSERKPNYQGIPPVAVYLRRSASADKGWTCLGSAVCWIRGS